MLNTISGVFLSWFFDKEGDKHVTIKADGFYKGKDYEEDDSFFLANLSN